MTPVTEQEIVDRPTMWENGRAYRATMLILGLLAIVTTPVWPVLFLACIHIHRELVLGILIGSTAELLIVLASRWLWDRYLWLKWFSHQ